MCLVVYFLNSLSFRQQGRGHHNIICQLLLASYSTWQFFRWEENPEKTHEFRQSVTDLYFFNIRTGFDSRREYPTQKSKTSEVKRQMI